MIQENKNSYSYLLKSNGAKLCFAPSKQRGIWVVQWRGNWNFELFQQLEGTMPFGGSGYKAAGFVSANQLRLEGADLRAVVAQPRMKPMDETEYLLRQARKENQLDSIEYYETELKKQQETAAFKRRHQQSVKAAELQSALDNWTPEQIRQLKRLLQQLPD